MVSLHNGQNPKRGDPGNRANSRGYRSFAAKLPTNSRFVLWRAESEARANGDGRGGHSVEGTQVTALYGAARSRRDSPRGMMFVNLFHASGRGDPARASAAQSRGVALRRRRRAPFRTHASGCASAQTRASTDPRRIHGGASALSRDGAGAARCPQEDGASCSSTDPHQVDLHEGCCGHSPAGQIARRAKLWGRTDAAPEAWNPILALREAPALAFGLGCRRVRSTWSTRPPPPACRVRRALLEGTQQWLSWRGVPNCHRQPNCIRAQPARQTTERRKTLALGRGLRPSAA